MKWTRHCYAEVYTLHEYHTLRLPLMCFQTTKSYNGWARFNSKDDLISEKKNESTKRNRKHREKNLDFLKCDALDVGQCE